MLTNRAAVLDLDGTLVHLHVDIEAVRQQIEALFAPLGYGRGFAPILQRIDEAAHHVATSDQDRRAWIRRGRAIIDHAERAAAMTVRPGARDLVAMLAAAAVPAGIVTNNGPGCVGPALRALDLDARIVVTRDHVAHTKPHPEGIVLAAKQLLPGGGEMWMLGDSQGDMRAACAARDLLADVRVHAVGVCGGRDSRADLEAAGAGMIVDHPGAFCLPAASGP